MPDTEATASITDIERDGTPELPPGYDSVRRRLAVFNEHLSGDYSQIMAWLLDWRERLFSHGKSLPAPWVFANEQDVVELEWEVGSRFLSLRLNPDGQFEYIRVDDSVTPIEEQAGAIAPEAVERLLSWVVA